MSERGLECVNIVKTFSGEVSLTKKILINVGNGGRVRIDSRISRKNSGKSGTRSADERNAYAWLHNAVAACDHVDCSIQFRPVEGMNRGAYEFARHISRKLR